MTIKKRIALLSLTALMVALIFGQMLVSMFCIRAEAEEKVDSSSNVLVDLSKDENFKAEDYPRISSEDYIARNNDLDKSNDVAYMTVIQIAVGESGELYVYVYQPIDDFFDVKASFVNISLQDNTADKTDFNSSLKGLTYLNNSGPLFKYSVSNFTVDIKKDKDNIFNISTIYKPYIEGFDEKPSQVEVLNHTGHAVGKIWKVYYYNDKLTYQCKKVDVVKVDILATGEVLYSDGFGFYASSCNAHYIGFNVPDYDINYVYDVDVTYKLEPVYTDINHPTPVVSNNRPYIEEESITLYDSDEVTYTGPGIFAPSYKWKRINTPTEFLDDVTKYKGKFSIDDREAILNCEYVIYVAETEDHRLNYGSVTHTFYRMVDGGILRLHFSTPTGTYNLGVVSDLVGTDGKPNAKTEIDWELWLKVFATLIVLIVIAIICAPLIGPIFRFFAEIFVSILSWAIKLFSFLIGKFFDVILLPLKLLNKKE